MDIYNEVAREMWNTLEGEWPEFRDKAVAILRERFLAGAGARELIHAVYVAWQDSRDEEALALIAAHDAKLLEEAADRAVQWLADGYGEGPVELRAAITGKGE